MTTFTSPEVRDKLIRAIIGEAAGEGPEGWQAVANVIKNRADSGRWGERQSVSQVLTPSQFSALNPNNPAFAQVQGADPNSPLYQRIGAVVDGVFGGSVGDITGGADHYYAPSGMGARQAPDWAKGGGGKQIGKHIFMSLGGGGAAPSSTGVDNSGSALENQAGTMGVDPRLANILNAAAQNFPGYHVKVTSGERKGDPRFHGKGMATDVVLIDPSGKTVPNYQDPAHFRTYETFAQEVRRQQQKLYPELDKQLRWGGYFSGGKGKYGAADLMHFDLGGSDALGMAGGSWEGGLTPAQKALWAGAVSQGMGGSQTPISVASGAPSTASVGSPATSLPAFTLASQSALPAGFRSAAQGSNSDWIMPDASGKIGAVGPAASKGSVPAATAGVQRASPVEQTPLPVARPATAPGTGAVQSAEGTPLPVARPPLGLGATSLEAGTPPPSPLAMRRPPTLPVMAGVQSWLSNLFG